MRHVKTGKYGYRDSKTGKYVHVVTQVQDVWEKDGPGHVAGEVAETRYTQYALCGVNLYSLWSDAAYPTLEAGHFTEGQLCPRCRKALQVKLQGKAP